MADLRVDPQLSCFTATGHWAPSETCYQRWFQVHQTHAHLEKNIPLEVMSAISITFWGDWPPILPTVHFRFQITETKLGDIRKFISCCSGLDFSTLKCFSITRQSIFHAMWPTRGNYGCGFFTKRSFFLDDQPWVHWCPVIIQDIGRGLDDRSSMNQCFGSSRNWERPKQNIQWFFNCWQISHELVGSAHSFWGWESACIR